MLSPTVRRTLSLIRPLYEPRLVQAVRERWGRLAKPPGSLGRLEDLILHYCLIRASANPEISRKGLYVFCADHGVVREGVSAWPQDITRKMVRTLLHGGACVNALCRQQGVEAVVVDMGVEGPLEAGAVNCRVGNGTGNFLRGEAMSPDQVNRALEFGILLAEEAARRFDLVAIGEMGIGNSTSAAAILSAMTGRDPAETAGYGAGLDELGLSRKVAVLRGALHRHKEQLISPGGVLQSVGGYDIAGMTGFLLGAAASRLPVVVDGFIAGSAAVVARAMAPDALDAAIFAHKSAERGHALMLEFLGVQPYLDLEMRLGEGTGAVLAIGLLEAGLRAYREMQTIEDITTPVVPAPSIQ